MKVRIIFGVCALLSASVCGGLLPSRAFAKAARAGALFKECLQIVDQDGLPVENALVELGIWKTDSPRDTKCIKGNTDKNGLYVAQGVVGPYCNYKIAKDGYYATQGRLEYGVRKTPNELKDGKWLPYGTSRNIVLKKMLDPVVPGRKSWTGKIPSLDEWLGFDLEKVDWVAPNGSGAFSDVKIRVSIREESYSDHAYRMELKFDESPSSGVYIGRKDKYSEFQTDYRADPKGSYRSECTFAYERENGKTTVDDMLYDDRYLVFRVRTRLNEDGTIKSAYYGTIRGSWQFSPRRMDIGGVYFNPKENDTNIEDIDAAECVKLRIRDSKPVE